MKVQKHNCPSCGAPLSAGSTIVKCDHCGSDLKISGLTGELRPFGQPQVQSAPAVRRPPMSRAKKLKIAGVIVSILVIAAMGLKIYNDYFWIRLVNGVAWSPDGKRIVSVHGQGRVDGGTMRVWDAANGNELNNFVLDDVIMWQVEWSPDGKYIATGQHDGLIEVWNVESMQVTQKLKGSTTYVDSFVWSPNSKMIAVGDDKGTLRAWNVESGEALYSSPVHTNRIDTVAWSPDGRMIATGAWDNTIRIINSATGKELFSVPDTSYLATVAWSPDGKFLASGGLSNLVKIIDIASSKEIFSLVGHKNSVRQVKWSPDGSLLASIASDNSLRIWDARNGKILQALDNDGYDQNIQWSPDGSHIASGGEGSVRIWNTKNWEVTTFSGYSKHSGVFIVGWSADGKQLLTVGRYEEEITLWDVAQQKKINTMQIGYLESFRRALF